MCIGIGLPIKQSSFLLQTAVLHRSTSRLKQSLFLSSLSCSYTDGNGFRCIYSVLIMHRRTDLWGPDGSLHSCFKDIPFIFTFQPSYSILIASWMTESIDTWLRIPSSFVLSMQDLVFVLVNRYACCESQIQAHIHKLKKKTFLFFSLPIMKRHFSLLAYYSSSLDLLWKNLKIFSHHLNGPLVMVWKELKRCALLRIWLCMSRQVSFLN